MNVFECPDCESETHLCKIHQKEEIAIDDKYPRNSPEWHNAMLDAGLT